MRELHVLLERLGPALRSYAGHGQLHVPSGEMLDVEFLAAQLPDGSNVLLCLGSSGRHHARTAMLLNRGVREFEGRTADGLQVATAGKIWPQSLPGELPTEGDWSFFCGYTVPLLRIGPRSGTPKCFRYGLTNVRPPWDPERLLRLRSGNATTKAGLLMVPGFRSIFDRIKALRGTAVTCELEIMAHENLTKNETDQVATDVSYLLSVAQGYKVAWIYRDEVDADGLLCTEHRMSKTAPFNPFELVPTHPYDVSEGFTDLQQFVEMTYPAYVRRRNSWRLPLGPIDSYLEAKAEADFLETRGAKLAVALESLKHRYLRSGEASIGEFIMDRRGFKKLVPELVSATRKVLPDQYSRVVDRNALRGKLQGINRRSLNQVVKHLASDIGVHLNSKERRMFVASRNALIHQGQFYCNGVEAGEVERTCTPTDSPVEEYFFMVNILDRIFLKLLGYSGPYFDRREPGTHRMASLP